MDAAGDQGNTWGVIRGVRLASQHPNSRFVFVFVSTEAIGLRYWLQIDQSDLVDLAVLPSASALASLARTMLQ